MTRLLLLTGLPGVGKSTLAARLGADGWFVVDPDRLRTADRSAADARDRAWAEAGAALDAGRDVVVAQLIARPDQLDRLAAVAAAGGRPFTAVLLQEPSGVLTAAAVADDDRTRADLGGAEGVGRLAAYARGLAALPGVRRLEVTPGDVDATCSGLRTVLGGGGSAVGTPS